MNVADVKCREFLSEYISIRNALDKKNKSQDELDKVNEQIGSFIDTYLAVYKNGDIISHDEGGGVNKVKIILGDNTEMTYTLDSKTFIVVVILLYALIRKNDDENFPFEIKTDNNSEFDIALLRNNLVAYLESNHPTLNVFKEYRLVSNVDELKNIETYTDDNDLRYFLVEHSALNSILRDIYDMSSKAEA